MQLACSQPVLLSGVYKHSASVIRCLIVDRRYPELSWTLQLGHGVLTTGLLKGDVPCLSPLVSLSSRFPYIYPFPFCQDLAGWAGSGAPLPEKLFPLVPLEAGHVEPAPAEDIVAFNTKAARQHRPPSRPGVHFIEAHSQAHKLSLCSQSPPTGRSG